MYNSPDKNQGSDSAVEGSEHAIETIPNGLHRTSSFPILACCFPKHNAKIRTGKELWLCE
jgi:hypothetical protein